MNRPGDVIADQFELVRVAGVGGMGEVWYARDRLRDAPVALKMLTGTGESGRSRFMREAVVLSELRHPGVVRYVAHGVTPSQEIYLAMEWLEGEDLAHRLERGALGVGETVLLIKNVAEALGAAHSRGIVHRDVKPSNMFLVGGAISDVKLLDFGVARAGVTTRTRAGAMVGTPGYMAPEQARGEEDVDARADIFALGCVAFECLTGRRAFEADHVMAVLAKILIDEVPRVSDLLPDIPPELDDVVRRMVAKDPAARPRDASELVASLEGIDDTVGEISQPQPSLTRGEQRMLAVALVPPAATSPTSTTVTSLREVAERHGARLDALADGSLLAVLSKKGVASDLAAQAAQLALALHAALPGRSVALTSGRAELGTFIAGDTIDRAAGLLAEDARAETPDGGVAGVRGVVLDDVTAGLLGARFQVLESGGRLELAGERELDEEPRTLLGKPTPCVGRERELASLEATFEECASEPIARAVLVTAGAGTGKSRLRNEVMARLRRSPAGAESKRGSTEVWMGRGDPMRAGSPFGLVGQTLRRACAISEGEPLSARQGKVRDRVARHVPDAERARVSEFLGELIGTPFSDKDSVQLRAARQDPMLMSDQVRGAWEDFLTAECAAGPVVLVLEDLHWGDLPSVKLVDAALRNLRDRPLMVLALARPEVHELFPKLWADRELQEIRLGGLTKKSSERLVRQVLGADVAPETVAKIVDRADGNAFYLEELIRAVSEGRGETLPDTMVAMVEARLEKLDPEARRILRAGSVFGQTFWKGSAAVLLGGQARVSDWLAELAEQELVSRRPTTRFPGEEEYAFRHALVRDGAYAMLTGDDRKLGHALAGDWLERMGEGDAMALAEHFERGDAKDRALKWYPRATEQALEGNDLEGALARADRGVSCGAQGATLGLLRCMQAEARNWRGDKSQALRIASEAMTLLPPGEAPWYTAAREAIITAHNTGNRDRVVEVVKTIHDAPANASAPAAQEARGLALGWAATMLLFAGKYADAERILDDLSAEWLGGASLNPRVEATINKAKAAWALYTGRDTAGQSMAAAVEGYERAGDLRNACNARIDLAFIVMEFGAYDEGELLLRQCLTQAERLGLLTSIPQVKHNLGLALMRVGKLEEAAKLEIEAAEAVKGQPRMEGLATTYLANILFRKGDQVAAEDAARRAAALLEVVPASRPMALALLARILLAREKKEEALERASEAMELLRSLGVLEEGEALVRLAYAEALHASGDPRSKQAITEAKEALVARANNIRDEMLRKSFLERIDENAATLALAESWLS